MKKIILGLILGCTSVINLASADVLPPKTNNFEVSRAQIDQQLKDYDEKIKAAKANDSIPEMRNGVVVGHRKRKRMSKGQKPMLDQKLEIKATNLDVVPNDQPNH